MMRQFFQIFIVASQKWMTSYTKNFKDTLIELVVMLMSFE